MDNISLKNFYKEFPTDEVCLGYLENERWPKGSVCPHCGSTKRYEYRRVKLFKCAECKKQFTAKTGTIFSDSHISLQDWFLAVQTLTSSKKPVSSVQLARDLGLTQKSAWLMLQRIRHAARYVELEKLDKSLADRIIDRSPGEAKREKPYKLDSSFRATIKKLAAAPKPHIHKKQTT